MKQIQLTGSDGYEYLIITVMENAVGFKMYKGNIIFDSANIVGWGTIRELPPGEWIILCRGDEVTEDQAKGIIEATEYYEPHAQPYPIPAYKGYVDGIWKWAALESFQSLLSSHGMKAETTLILVKK